MNLKLTYDNLTLMKWEFKWKKIIVFFLMILVLFTLTKVYALDDLESIIGLFEYSKITKII